MISITKRQPLVQDLHHHSPEQIAELRHLIFADAPSRPDPRRPGFFEIDGSDNIFYIFKYPTGTKVLLLGVWERDPVAELVSCVDCSA